MTTEKTKGGGDIERSFTTLFSLADGKSPDQSSTKRHLADVKQMFVDTVEAERILEKENPLVYEFYELGIPSDPGDLAFGTSITYPGQVAGEYYMTKDLFFKTAIKISVIFIMNSASNDFLGKHELQTAVTDGTVINRLRISGDNLFSK